MTPIDQKINQSFKNKHPSECRVIIKPNKWGVGIPKIDKFLEENSLSSAEGKWNRIDFGQAKAIFINITSKSICYGSLVIDEKTAEKYANNFFSNFDPCEAEYYTNLILNKYPIPFDLKKLSNCSASQVLPDYLISIAIVAIESNKIGVFVRGERD